MSTSTSERDLAQYADKKVTIVRNLPEPNEKGEGVVEIEGVVQVANEHGLLIKPKGQVKFELVPASEIEEVYLAKETTKKLKRSKLKLVPLGQARRHLIERHGITLEWANNVTEEQAMEYHASLDHAELDLGHIHVDKSSENEDDDNENDSGDNSGDDAEE